MTARTETRDGFTFTKRSGAWWSVYDGAEFLGYAWRNGSSLRERSWTYRTPTGQEGRTGQRRWAAQALQRLHTS